LEASLDNSIDANAWVALFEQTNQECSKQVETFFFPIQNSDLFSTFRFTMIGSNSHNETVLYLEQFDLKGHLIDSSESISSLKALASIIPPSIDALTKYHFQISEPTHSGLLSFLSRFPSKIALNHFSLYQSSTVQGTCTFNLFLQNNTVWTSNDMTQSYIKFILLSNLSFQIEGYKIKSGEKYFPQSWKVEGITAQENYILIDEQTNNHKLCSKFTEFTFPIQEYQQFIGFKVTQTNTNKEGTEHFSLSTIEFFGILSI
jgi:hypothetical protein